MNECSFINRYDPITMTATLSDANSKRFRFWSFVSMVLLVFVHGYNLDIRFLHPATMPGEPLTFTAFFEYWTANGLLRFRIPMLFLISGYLFAMHDLVPQGQRMKKRLRTLLVPYLLWSAAGLALVVAMEMTVLGTDILRTTRMLWYGGEKMLLSDYAWYEVLERWIMMPVPYQLWFLRSLLMLNLLYPALRWCVTHPNAPRYFFPFAVLFWLASFGILFIEGEGLLFFSLGIWMQKRSFDLDGRAPLMRPMWWGMLFVGTASVKSVLAFTGIPGAGDWIYPLLLLLHKFTVLSGVIFAWFAGRGRAERWMERRWFASLAAYSFVIYAMHAPFVAFAIDGVFRYVHHLPFYRLGTFILLPLTIIAMCVLVGWVLKRTVPRFYGLLTGGRGLA